MSKPIKPKVECLIYRNGELKGTQVVTGRVAWALLWLIAMGSQGCTPVNRPAPRWSDYVFRLRGQGFDVATIDEAHDGPYAGTHARYVLRDRVDVFGGNLAEYLRSADGRREFGHVQFRGMAA